jgi:hypothetical protein
MVYVSWDILRALATSRYGLTRKEIAKAVDLHPRSVIRYMFALIDLDIGVEYVARGPHLEKVYTCKNYVIIAKNAPRAQFCRGCGEPVKSGTYYCGDPCRRKAAECPAKSKGIPLDGDDPPVPRGTWPFENKDDMSLESRRERVLDDFAGDKK